MLKAIDVQLTSDKERWFEALRAQLQQDAGRNYFLLLGIRSFYKTYDKVWFEPTEGIVLASRRSGNAQLFIDQRKIQSPKTMETLMHLLSELAYKELITNLSSVSKMPRREVLGTEKPRSFIARLERGNLKTPEFLKAGLETEKLTFKKLSLEILPQIMAINHRVFAHSASEAMLIERLSKGYGRAFGLLDSTGKLLCTLQTECEGEDVANLVGVATEPEYQGQGLASFLVYSVVKILEGEGKTPHLMFDNLKAGRIYQTLGFEIYDQTVHFCKP